MVISAKKTIIGTLLASVVSFTLYAFAFEPYGVAEFAYVFAIPVILACKILFVENQYYKKILIAFKRTENEKTKVFYADILKKFSSVKKTYLWSTFIGSYLAWIGLLVWLRHVYPPSGWIAVFGLPLVVAGAFVFPWFALLPKLLPKSEEDALSRLIKIAGLAGLWVLLEWVRSWIFTGFPWLLLGHSQWTRIAVIQSASWGGVWIVSFTLIFFNLAVSEYLYKLYVLQKSRFLRDDTTAKLSKFTPEFYVALLLVVSGVWTYIANLPRLENEEHKFKAGLVQTDFAGILKWSDALSSENLKVVKDLSTGLAKTNVDVILYPEAATPPRYPINFLAMRKWIEDMAKDLKTPLLMGNMIYNTQTDTAQNGVFFISETEGLSKEYYAKKHLVPFGEYVPAIFSFMGKIVPVGNMKAGETDTPINVKIKNKNYKMGAMICYEDVFPNLARTMAKNGSDMIFVCTNDSWYGKEAGAWQHAAHSALASVSTRKIILRASNNGLSTVFDQYGRMLPSTVLKTSDGKVWNGANGNLQVPLDLKDEFGKPLDAKTLLPKRPAPMLDNNGSIYFRGCGIIDVISYKNFDNKETFYVRYGDWVVVLSGVLVCFSLLKIWFENRKTVKKSLK